MGFTVTITWGYQIPSSAIAGQVRPRTSHSSWNRVVSFFGTEQKLVLISLWATVFSSCAFSLRGPGSFRNFSRKRVGILFFPWTGDVCSPGFLDWQQEVTSWRAKRPDYKKAVSQVLTNFPHSHRPSWVSLYQDGHSDSLIFLLEYNCFTMLVSAIQWHESAIRIGIFPLSWTSLPLPI